MGSTTSTAVSSVDAIDHYRASHVAELDAMGLEDFNVLKWVQENDIQHVEFEEAFGRPLGGSDILEGVRKRDKMLDGLAPTADSMCACDSV
jgi:hypothetical protein